MKTTDFAYYLTGFLSKYLPSELGASANTISSYRDTFILFLRFVNKYRNISAENISLKMINTEMVTAFLDWIENERKCSTSTRNVRLAAIHSFFCYLQYENPDNIVEWQRILAIPVKKTQKKAMNYMSIEGIKLLLEIPDRNTKNGRRDLTLLSLMYDTAARVQEIIDLTPSRIRLEAPLSIKLIGKGNKERIVPLMTPMADILVQYLEENNLKDSYSNQYPLFQNKKKEKLTRAGISYILNKYVDIARQENASAIPLKFTCHCLRHSKAMHLLQAGVNLVYIRDILGHRSVTTTEIYARVDSKQKREVIEKAYTHITPSELPEWQTNNDLLEWLKNFNK